MAAQRPVDVPAVDLTQQHYGKNEGPFHRENPIGGSGAGCEPFASAAAVGADQGEVEGVLDQVLGQLELVKDGGLFARYPIRGRWWKETRFGPLRNAAWLVRNSRHGQGNNPMALKVAVVEVERLVGSGEPLSDVVEALCELLVHP